MQRESTLTSELTKAELLDFVLRNKKKHVAMHAEALIGYAARVRAELSKQSSKLDLGDVENVSINMMAPQSYARSYAQAISMVENTIAETVPLSAQDYATLVMDDWDWTDTWVRSNRGFAASIDTYGSDKAAR